MLINHETVVNVNICLMLIVMYQKVVHNLSVYDIMTNYSEQGQSFEYWDLLLFGQVNIYPIFPTVFLTHHLSELYPHNRIIGFRVIVICVKH